MKLRCSYSGCTKMFANKYNVKRHVENVHLKLKRRHNKSSSISNNSNSKYNNICSRYKCSSSNNSSTRLVIWRDLNSKKNFLKIIYFFYNCEQIWTDWIRHWMLAIWSYQHCCMLILFQRRRLPMATKTPTIIRTCCTSTIRTTTTTTVTVWIIWINSNNCNSNPPVLMLMLIIIIIIIIKSWISTRNLSQTGLIRWRWRPLPSWSTPC